MIKRLLICTTALWLSMGEPANAAGLVAGIGAVFSSLGAVGTAVAGVAFNLATSWIMSLFTEEPKRLGIKEEMETGGDNPPAFIVGRYVTPGQLAYVNSWDKPGANIENQLLVYVILLSALPVSALSTKVIVQGETCNIDISQSFSGFHPVTEYVKGTGGGGYCSIKFKDGTQTAVDDWLLDKFGDHPDYPIDEDMWWKGCAHVIVQCWASNRNVWTGIPEFKFIVDGIPLYDPRKDSSVGGSGPQRWNDKSTWSVAPRNPKVFAYNAIRGISYGGRKVWGGDAEAYRLPLEYWFAAMNRCDENVTKGNGEVINRFEFSGEISFDADPKDILNEIDKTCTGRTTEYAGTYKTWVGEPGLSVATFTDDDIIVTEEQEDTPYLPPEETYNTAYAVYTEPREKWGPKDGPQYQDADALEEDGREVAIDVQLPYVTERNQVQRILRSIVKDSRRQVQHQFQLPPIAFVLEPYDRVTFISKSRGYTGGGKDFLIASQDDLANANQRSLFREFNINDLADHTEYADDISVGPVINVRPAGIYLEIDVFADQVDSPGGKKDRPAIRAEWAWDGLEIGIRAILYFIRRAGTTKIIAKGSIRDPEAGSAIIQHAILRFGGAYEIQFVPELFKAQSNAYTAWLPVTCVIVDVPAQPTLTRISKLSSDGWLSYFLDVSWTSVAQESSYLVRTIVDGDTVLYPANASPLRIPAVAGSTVIADVAAVGADGTVGDFSPTRTITVTKKNTAPTAPTSLTATGKIGRIDLKTNKNPDSDFSHFNLYASDTNDFATAVLIDDPKSVRFQEGDLGNLVTRYYWITAVDRSDNESSKFPISNTGGRVATTARVGAPDLDDNSVTPIKADLGDMGNGLRDAKMEFMELWELSPDDTAGCLFAQVLNVDNVMGGSAYYFSASATLLASQANIAAFQTKPVNACSGGRRYSFSGNFRLDAFPGAGGSDRVRIGMRVRWYKVDGSGNPVQLAIGAMGSIVTLLAMEIGYVVPLRFAASSPVDASLYALEFFFISYEPTPASSAVEISVGGAYAREASYSIVETQTVSGNQTVAAGTTAAIITQTSNHTGGAIAVKVGFGFKNNTGAQRTVDITFRRGSTDLYTIPNVTLPDNADWFREFTDSSPTGEQTDYKLALTAGATAVTVNSRTSTAEAKLG